MHTCICTYVRTYIHTYTHKDVLYTHTSTCISSLVSLMQGHLSNRVEGMSLYKHIYNSYQLIALTSALGNHVITS